MFKKSRELTYRKLLDGVELGTMVHGEKTLMAQFKLEKGCTIPAHSHTHEPLHGHAHLYRHIHTHSHGHTR